jgi:hypothetical protein
MISSRKEMSGLALEVCVPVLALVRESQPGRLTLMLAAIAYKGRSDSE